MFLLLRELVGVWARLLQIALTRCQAEGHEHRLHEG